MTWLKTSDDFPDECARAGLSDAAYRTHHEGLSWVMRRETGGWLDERDVRRFAETADPEAAIEELLSAGFWVRDGRGYRILHHLEYQPEPDVMERRRKLAAERQRKHRRKKAGLSSDLSRVTPLQDALLGTGRGGTERENRLRREEQAGLGNWTF